MKKQYLIFLILFILIVGILAFSPYVLNNKSSLIIDFGTFIATIIGFAIALNQLKISSDDYLDKINKSKEDFLDLSIIVDNVDDYIKVKTQIINKSGENKNIKFAILVVSEQESNFISKINELVPYLDINYTNDLIKLENIPSEINEHDFSIIPLKFYYQENIGIANENPSYSHILNTSKLSLEKNYSIRFFIFPGNDGYHRSTADSFKV